MEELIPTVPGGGAEGLDAKTFQAFCDFIYQQSGITLKPGKESLVSARIAKRMRKTGHSSPREYLQFVKSDSTGVEVVHLLDAISTNLTSFFRESVHFDVLGDVLRKWKAEGQLRFRIWCAAASTGEEPYSLAMTALEALGPERSDTRILCTDISTEVLAKCKQGVYDEQRLKTVPHPLRDKYFDRSGKRGEATYTVRPCLRELTFFRRLNLSTPPFPMRGPMDVVFCRNVMIYFDDRVRKRLVDEIFRLLKPGGYLMVGHSESLARLAHSFETIRPAVYRKPAR